MLFMLNLTNIISRLITFPYGINYFRFLNDISVYIVALIFPLMPLTLNIILHLS